MPYTPFARFLAVALVLLCGVALLWPDDRAYLWLFYALGAVPVLLGIFTVCAVRSAPPFDDRSFHRGLPPGDGYAFFRVLWIHLLVLAGIALLVVVYCLLMNFGWRAMGWGILMFTLPVWAFCSAVGLTATAASSNQHWKSLSWIAILAMPFFSLLVLLQLALPGMAADGRHHFLLPPLHSVVLTSAVVYPLCWWLAAVARRRSLSLALGGTMSFLIPWLAVYGGFGERERVEKVAVVSNSASLTISRKPLPQDAGPWVPAGDVFEVSGLKEGEHMILMPEKIRDDRSEVRSLVRGSYVIDGVPQGAGETGLWGFTASMKGGQVRWGMMPVWQEIRDQLPAHESFESLDPNWEVQEGDLMVRVPGDGETAQAPVETKRLVTLQNLTRQEFFADEWQAWVNGPTQWQRITSCRADEGISVNASTGGKLKVLPAELSEAGHWEIPIKVYQEELWQAGGAWDAKANERQLYFMVLFTDESGKQVRVARRSESNRKNVMLGVVWNERYDAGDSDREGFRERNEALKNSQVHVFFRLQSIGHWEKRLLPAPGN